jgi:hypothetical protein
MTVAVRENLLRASPETRPPDTRHLLNFAFYSLTIPQFAAASKAGVDSPNGEPKREGEGGVFLDDPPRRDGKASLGALISAETQGGYAGHGPAALTSRAPNPVPTALDNLIRELGQCDFVLPAPFPCGNYILSLTGSAPVVIHDS